MKDITYKDVIEAEAIEKDARDDVTHALAVYTSSRENVKNAEFTASASAGVARAAARTLSEANANAIKIRKDYEESYWKQDMPEME